MTAPHVNIKCPHCQRALRFDMRNSTYLRRREAELQARESQVAEREKLLRVQESEHQHDVRVIKSALHPDRHPEESDRYTRAWQAFERLLASANTPNVPDFNDDIPF
jgi:hypothetical protein